MHPGLSVKMYPYRTAQADKHVMSFPRTLCQSMEEDLAKHVGKHIDNHTVYAVSCEDWAERFITYTPYGFPKTVYLQFSDAQCIVGVSVIEGKW